LNNIGWLVDRTRASLAVFCSIIVIVAFVASTPLAAAKSLAKTANETDRTIETLELIFPKDYSIGWFYELAHQQLPRLNPMNCVYRGDAKGKVMLRADRRFLALACNNRALQDTAWLKKLPANRIGLLCLTDTKVDDKWLVNLKIIPWVTNLHLSRTKITDEGLAKLRILPKLRLLSIENSTLDGSGLKYLSGCKELSDLSCDGSNLSPTNLHHLGTVTSLQTLNCRDTGIQDEHLQPLLGLKALRILDLAQTKITDAGVKELARLPRLKRLDISYTAATFKSLKLLSGCKSLTWLLLNGCDLTGINSKSIPTGLSALNVLEASGVDDSLVLKMNLSKFKDLDFGKTKITRKSVAALADSKSLVTLGLARLRLSDKDVAPLSTLLTLENLFLEGNPLTSDGIWFLPRMSRLNELRLTRTNLDDRAVETLKKCKSLKFLTLSYTNISKNAVESLRKSLPNCRIEHNSF